jgi:hypothetical protein
VISVKINIGFPVQHTVMVLIHKRIAVQDAVPVQVNKLSVFRIYVTVMVKINHVVVAAVTVHIPKGFSGGK